MAYKPPPGPTQAGTNLPSPPAGLTDDEKREQEFLKEKLAEEEKEQERKRAAAKHIEGKSGVAKDFQVTGGFRIVNNSNTHLNVSQGGVNPDGTPRWTVLKHLDPGEFMDFTNSVEALKVEIQQEE